MEGHFLGVFNKKTGAWRSTTRRCLDWNKKNAQVGLYIFTDKQFEVIRNDSFPNNIHVLVHFLPIYIVFKALVEKNNVKLFSKILS